MKEQTLVPCVPVSPVGNRILSFAMAGVPFLLVVVVVVVVAVVVVAGSVVVPVGASI